MKELLKSKNIVATLQYRGSEHGWMAADFFSKSAFQSASIILVKMKEGPCIGGFTQASWKTKNQPISIRDSSAMIFNLTNYQNYPVNNQQRAISCFKKGISFGDEEL